MKALVTGGRGFIGGHVVERLVKEGAKVVVLDDLSTGNCELPMGVTFIWGRVEDDWTPLFVSEKFTHVFHLAALPRVQFSIQEPVKTTKANIDGTVNMLELARKHAVSRFVFSSSSSVYGDQPTLPLKEDMTPNPMSPYALQKLVGEYYCSMFRKIHGLEVVALRYFNVYGPRQKPDGAYATLIPKFIDMYRHGRIPQVNGDGTQTRDFTFVDDVVEANILAARTKNESAFGKAFNIGAGNSKSVNYVVGKIMELSKRNTPPIYGPAVIEPKNTCADVSASWKILGWKPQVSFDEGICRAFEWYERTQS